MFILRKAGYSSRMSRAERFCWRKYLALPNNIAFSLSWFLFGSSELGAIEFVLFWTQTDTATNKALQITAYFNISYGNVTQCWKI